MHFSKDIKSTGSASPSSRQIPFLHYASKRSGRNPPVQRVTSRSPAKEVNYSFLSAADDLRATRVDVVTPCIMAFPEFRSSVEIANR